MKKIILLKDHSMNYLIENPYDLKDLYYSWVKETLIGTSMVTDEEFDVMTYILDNYIDIFYTYKNNNTSGYTLEEFEEEVKLYMRDHL